jgi:hypothetical protein
MKISILYWNLFIGNRILLKRIILKNIIYSIHDKIKILKIYIYLY